MKNIFLIWMLFAILIAIPAASFAENPTSCTFGDKSTSLDDIFEKDFAVKAFAEKHQNVTRTIPTDESGSLKNQLVLQAQSDGIKEKLEVLFHTDENGCYIPASYRYSYDDGIIDATVRNSVANFTEIMNLIKSDDLDIEDFYPDDCSFVDLDVMMSNGKSYGVCKEAERTVTILIDAASEGSLKVDIPIGMVYSLPSADWVPTGDFFIILDREETRYEITPTETGNLVTVEFPERFHKIRIAGSVIIPDPSPAQYCGIVDGYSDKKYLAPLDQTDHGVSSKSIRCNEGLILVQKYDETPACVKEKTIPKLIDRGWTAESETKKLWKSTDDWNSLRLIRNDNNLYCNSANEESSDQCYSLEEIIFGNARKSWTVYPGGAGYVPPQNSTLVRIYNEVDFGIQPLNFTAMLDDKIFVNKCESNGGVWNYTYHDCENLWQICRDVGGIMIQEDISEPCTEGTCLDRKVYRMSCVFEYEN